MARENPPRVDRGITSSPQSDRTEFRQTVWERRLAELLDFRRREGHVNVPKGWPENPRLATWVANQRRLIGSGALEESRARRLEREGVLWAGGEARREVQQAAWDRMFASLRAFQRAHGHLRVPRGWASAPALAAWISTQRFLRKIGMLAQEREAALEALGFPWHSQSGRPGSSGSATPEGRTRSQSWERMVSALEHYRKTFGDCAVPSRWEKDRRLAAWVIRQRLLKREGKLSRERVELLDRLGFAWSGTPRRAAARDRRWNEMASALSDYAKRHGHCTVSEEGPLKRWVARQRNDHRRGKLRADRVRALEALKFDWAPAVAVAKRKADLWERMHASLCEFVKVNGHAELSGYGRSRGLLRWLNGQRRLKQKGRLSAERQARLESAGVSWSLRDRGWEARFIELKDYRRLHGDCNVPMGTREHRVLARWISNQRAKSKQGRLDPAARERLDEIGFLWAPPTHRPAPSPRPAAAGSRLLRAR